MHEKSRDVVWAASLVEPHRRVAVYSCMIFKTHGGASLRGVSTKKDSGKTEVLFRILEL